MLDGPYQLAPMQESDLDEVLVLEQRSFSEPWTRKMFLGELHGNAFATNLVLRADKLLGYVMFWVVFEELHIMNLAVLPEVRRQGLGTALVRYVLTAAAAHGARMALLEVRASNVSAITMYRRLGFVQKSVRKGYYNHPREDAVIMMRELLEKGGHTMLSEDPAILDLVRKEHPEFRTLEETHQRLEHQLAELTKLHFLTPEEEQRKKRIQFDKLATKDRMADIVRQFKQQRSLAAGPSS